MAPQLIQFDEQEMAAAAKLTAACEHSANEHGVCVYCGALQPSEPDVSWEPPVRRSKLFRSDLRVTASVGSVTFEGIPSHDGWIRKWFIKTDVTSVQREQLPWLRVNRDARFVVTFDRLESPFSGGELQLVAMLALDDERHQPVAMRRI